jgi:glycosyltransferase involved in cell wall biosynthesis
MRVGFDVSPLVRPFPAGVVRAVAGALGALERRARLEVVRLAPGAADDLRRWRAHELPRAARDLDLSGIHSFTSAFAWRGRGARVQTVHELPWRHGVRENAGLGHRAWAALGPLLAEAVCVPSQHVARDLSRGVQRWLGGRTRIRVVPWGVDARFAPEPPAGTIDEAVIAGLRIPDAPFVLCLGATRAKKNLAAVLHGLAALRSSTEAPLHLVVTGHETPQLRADLGLASKLGLARWVLTVGHVEERALPSLLRLATCVPVLSRSEGFAFPVLEALACGTPVLVPEASAQSELAGEPGLRVDVDQPAAVAAALARARRERMRLRTRLCERAAAFTWDACAEGLERLWGDLA